MRCPKCGQQLGQTDVECPNCGEPTEWAGGPLPEDFSQRQKAETFALLALMFVGIPSALVGSCCFSDVSKDPKNEVIGAVWLVGVLAYLVFGALLIFALAIFLGYRLKKKDK